MLCEKAGMLLTALTSCGRGDLATYVKVRQESTKRNLIHKTQGTAVSLFHKISIIICNAQGKKYLKITYGIYA